MVLLRSVLFNVQNLIEIHIKCTFGLCTLEDYLFIPFQYSLYRDDISCEIRFMRIEMTKKYKIHIEFFINANNTLKCMDQECIWALKLRRFLTMLIALLQISSGKDIQIMGHIFYPMNKIMWEMIQNGQGKKLEMNFSDITAIRANFESPYYLEIEVNFFIEFILL